MNVFVITFLVSIKRDLLGDDSLSSFMTYFHDNSSEVWRQSFPQYHTICPPSVITQLFTNHSKYILLQHQKPLTTTHTSLQQPPPVKKNWPHKLTTSRPSVGVKNQFPHKNQIEKLGRFPDRHFCLYFGSGLHWDQARSQAQNTSKNDNLENGPYMIWFFVGTDSRHLQRAGICSVWLVNFFERAVAVKEVCLIMVAETMFFQISQVCKVFFT